MVRGAMAVTSSSVASVCSLPCYLHLPVLIRTDLLASTVLPSSDISRPGEVVLWNVDLNSPTQLSTENLFLFSNQADELTRGDCSFLYHRQSWLSSFNYHSSPCCLISSACMNVLRGRVSINNITVISSTIAIQYGGRYNQPVGACGPQH